MKHLDFGINEVKDLGSCAIYIETWHKDIFDVLDIRKKNR